jgi:energy-coupling factor transporter ATP-binding protein EcfA2
MFDAVVFDVQRLSKVHRMGEVEVHALHESHFTVLLGPSGSGKSTLLNILGGLDVATTGRVLYPGGVRRGNVQHRRDSRGQVRIPKQSGRHAICVPRSSPLFLAPASDREPFTELQASAGRTAWRAIRAWFGKRETPTMISRSAGLTSACSRRRLIRCYRRG